MPAPTTESIGLAGLYTYPLIVREDGTVCPHSCSPTSHREWRRRQRRGRPHRCAATLPGKRNTRYWIPRCKLLRVAPRRLLAWAAHLYGEQWSASSFICASGIWFYCRHWPR